MNNFAIFIGQLNYATKQRKSFLVVPTNKFLESIAQSLYKHQFIKSFFVKNNKITIFFRYKQGKSVFSEINLISAPSRMLSFNKHRLLNFMKKNFQEYFFFTTPCGIRVYTFFDLYFLKENSFLGFLLFSIRI